MSFDYICESITETILIYHMKYLSIFTAITILALMSSCQGSDPRIVTNTTYVSQDDDESTIIQKAVNTLPSYRQVDAMNNEFIAFIHFGPNTFTAMEWGTGTEDPKVFNLTELDTDQWCQVMKDAGMKMAILTVKHHDGFVLWQSRYTKHGIMSTVYKDGQGDILRELSESCKKYGIKLGVYLSPADLYQMEAPDGLYGNESKATLRTIPREVEGRPFENTTKFEFVVDDYNEYFLNQLFELLTEYGPIDEVWFDGAHPRRKGGQQYDYASWRKLIRTLVPDAVVFGREDIRWCGNEGGGTREQEWNVITYEENPDSMEVYRDITESVLGTREFLLSKEKPFYLHYQPAETNTSIREGWFWRNDDEQPVRTPDNVFDIYERAVGGNSIFLLNIPPNTSGRFSDRDVATLEEVGRRIRDTYGVNLLLPASKGSKALFDNNPSTSVKSDELVVEMKKAQKINRLVICEPVQSSGERIEAYAIDVWENGSWKEVYTGTNVGRKHIARFPAQTTNKVRVRILSSRDKAIISELSAHYFPERAPRLAVSQGVDGLVTITPAAGEFRWNRISQIAEAGLNMSHTIHYTLDGTTPDENSPVYSEAFKCENAIVSAVAMLDGNPGEVTVESIGYDRSSWKLSIEGNSYVQYEFDKVNKVSAINYLPPTGFWDRGFIESGKIQYSLDGKTWKTSCNFTFGNIVNDPSRRSVKLPSPVDARYLRIVVDSIAGSDRLNPGFKLEVL